MLNDFFELVQRLVTYFTIYDFLDIVIVSFLFYYLMVFIRDTRAQQLMKGILVIAVAYMMASWLKLNTLMYVIEIIINNGVMAMIIIFQPELRSFLEHMGRSKLSVSSLFGVSLEDAHEAQLGAINGVVEAFRTLQKQKMGALVVFEREDLLNDIAATGTRVDSVPTAGVIANIFFNKAPLHDGAMIIRDGRVHSAGCILPLTNNNNISMELGTRHRAAIGMSENSDAVVVVLSEETGQLSIAIHGDLQRFDTVTQFTSVLMQVLLPEDEESVSKSRRFWNDVKGRFSSGDAEKKKKPKSKAKGQSKADSDTMAPKGKKKKAADSGKGDQGSKKRKERESSKENQDDQAHT